MFKAVGLRFDAYLVNEAHSSNPTPILADELLLSSGSISKIYPTAKIFPISRGIRTETSCAL
jgi:hypothetical protein